MDNDLEKGTANPEPKINNIGPQTSHHEQRTRDGELERGLNSGDIVDHNIQTQDFATAPRPSRPAHAWRPSVEGPEADGATPRAPSPVYGQRESLGSWPTSIAYGDRLSMESGNRNQEEYGTGVARSPSPIYGQRHSSESQNWGEHDQVSGPRSPSPVYGQRSSIGSRGSNGHQNQHEVTAGPRSPSPVYGLRASLEAEPIADTDGLRILEKQITSSFSNGIRTSLEGKTSLPETPMPPHPSSALPTTEPAQERQLDFSWIVRHHNKHLVAPIKLEHPGKARKFAESVKELRLPWQEKRPTKPSAGWEREDAENSVRISIAELHRIRLRKLQCKLVNHAWYMKQFNKEPPAQTNPDGIAGVSDSTKTTTWEDDLQEYTKALQDYDYMTKCSALPRDYFLVSGERKVDDYVMREIIGVRTPPSTEQAAIPVVGPWEDVNQPIGGTRNENIEKSWMKGFRTRVVMAALGGTFLVGPMWLMVLLREHWVYTALVSTTVFVYAFGMFMSALLEKPMDVLSGTAAYAAVLVVFVGLGQDPGSSQAVAGVVGAANSTVGG